MIESISNPPNPAGTVEIEPLPEEAHLGHIYAVRQFACDALEDDPHPGRLALVEPTLRWVAAAVAGAASVQSPASRK